MRRLHAALLMSFIVLMLTTPVFAQAAPAAAETGNFEEELTATRFVLRHSKLCR